MSGPVTPADTAEVESADAESSVASAVLEGTESRVSRVGEFEVRRALPRRTRRMVGAWCFVDHMGPATAARFGHVDSQLPRYHTGPPPWRPQ